MPAQQCILNKSHAIGVTGYDDQKEHFTFQNSWGTTWGDSGYGYLPYKYFDKYILEAWSLGPLRPQYPSQINAKTRLLNWGTAEFGDTLHGVEIIDSNAAEQIGWGFARRADNFLDVEELFVKPAFRKKGCGREICGQLAKLGNDLDLPLRFWIPHADRSPNNLSIVRKLINPLGLTVIPSHVKWASHTTIDSSLKEYETKIVQADAWLPQSIFWRPFN
jgi:GNAT superfamily N-acetyltransferase